MRRIASALCLILVMLVAPLAHAAAPENDNFASALELSVPSSISVNTTEATVEVGEPVLACNQDERPTLNTVWFKVDPGDAQHVLLNTWGSDYDSITAVWAFYPQNASLISDVIPFSNMFMIACDDRGLGDALDFYTDPDAVYYVQSGGHAVAPGGNLQVSVELPGSISGSVTFADPVVTDTVTGGSAPVARKATSLCVEVIPVERRGGYYVRPGEDAGYYQYFMSDVADADGSWSVSDVMPGQYRIWFSECNGGTSEWYNDKPDWSDAELVLVEAGKETAGINASLTYVPPPPPVYVDLSVSSISIENVRLRTDEGPLVGSGYNRKVHLELKNSSFEQTGGWYDVWACPKSAGGCRSIAEGWASFSPQEVFKRTFDRNAIGSAGDVSITARICPGVTGHIDTDISNNSATVEHYSMVGGTGFGADVWPFSGGLADPYRGCWSSGTVYSPV